MPGMAREYAVLALALSFAACVLGADQQFTDVYVPGGSAYGWAAPPPSATFFQTWAARHKYYVNDTILFYVPEDAVVGRPIEVSSSDYASCTSNEITSGNNAVQSFLGLSNLLVADLVDTGTSYYIDSDPKSCRMGLKFQVDVQKASARPSGPSNAAVPLSAAPSFGAGLAAFVSLAVLTTMNFAL